MMFVFFFIQLAQPAPPVGGAPVGGAPMGGAAGGNMGALGDIFGLGPSLGITTATGFVMPKTVSPEEFNDVI